VPTAWPDADFHYGLQDLRDKLYAHTDRDSGRTVTMRITNEQSETAFLTEAPSFGLAA
jgi:hypothetical protein